MYRVLMLIWGVPKSSLSKEGWGQHFSHSQRKSKRCGKCLNILNNSCSVLNKKLVIVEWVDMSVTDYHL